MKIYVFDLDGTICVPNPYGDDSATKYGRATPIPSTIARMQRLHAAGERIIIHTARRMLTHKGDVTMVITDVGAITHRWLTYHKVPFDELIFGKPYGDYYVDDKALTPADLFSLPLPV